MKTLLKIFICLLLLFAFSCGGGEKKSNESMDEAAPEPLEEAVDEGTTDMNFEVEDAYKCPMDCEEGKEYDEEGACPVCGMSLKHVDEEAHDDSDGHHKEDEDHEDHEEEGKTDKDFSDE